MLSKTAAVTLQDLISSPSLSFLMEAHNGLSAKLAEEAGFAGIWASGLSIATALGVRDANEVSWTQVLEVLECMADAVNIPVLVDGDTGHGNFNNVRRFVRKLGERGLAGVCLEDKLFPKLNSFVGDNQPLADTQEFCGRIKAALDARTSDAFVVVARIEALVSGQGMREALKRADAYAEAGADAILIHSKRPDASEIKEFCNTWQARCPIVVVPTTYFRTPTDEFRRMGISTAIWANQAMRASLAAMRRVMTAIRETESVVEIEPHIATLKDVFSLVDNDELCEAERKYLPSSLRDEVRLQDPLAPPSRAKLEIRR